MPGQERDAPASDRLGLDAGPQVARVLRDRARDFALAHGAGEELTRDVGLAVTEAATNALVHAFVDRAAGTVTLDCESLDGALRFTVADDGRGIAARDDSPGLGMGLPTIGRLASGLDVGPGTAGRGTRVVMTFTAPGASITPTGHDELLLAAGRLADEPTWPGRGVDQLAALVCGVLADAVCVDVVERGTLRRVAARVEGDAGLSAWLASSMPPLRPGTSTWRTLQTGEPQLTLHDPAAMRPVTGPGETLGLEWWLACPLPGADGHPLGILGLGGRGTTPAPDDAGVAVAVAVARRAAGGLTQARVLDGLQRTRRRLERLLDLVSDEVVVRDAGGAVLWANAAARAGLDGSAPAPGETTTHLLDPDDPDGPTVIVHRAG